VTFHGSLGAGATAPPDPFAGLAGGVAAATNGGKGGKNTASTGPSAGAGTGASALGTVAGGSGRQQDTKPVSFNGPAVPGLGLLPALVLLAMVAAPPTVMVINRWIRRRGLRA
jgi:phosphate transport system substrate-binding protein